MAIVKRGEGSILPEPEQKKAASKAAWTEQDQAELDAELAEDDDKE